MKDLATDRAMARFTVKRESVSEKIFKSSPGMLRTRELTPTYQKALVQAGLRPEESWVIAAAVARRYAEDIPLNQLEKGLIQRALCPLMQSGLWRSSLMDQPEREPLPPLQPA